MSNKAYNYKFKMFVEGVEAPFYNATIICTPNGVEASINIPANKEALELKPKTAVQIFYYDFIGSESSKGWRLMFDGFYSCISRLDQAGGGRTIGIVCRDFRMDIRKAPAALAYIDNEELTVQNYYNRAGIFQQSVIGGMSAVLAKKKGVNAKFQSIRLYGNDGLTDLPYVLQQICLAAIGKADPNKMGVNFSLKPNPKEDLGSEAGTDKAVDAAAQSAENKAIQDRRNTVEADKAKAIAAKTKYHATYKSVGARPAANNGSPGVSSPATPENAPAQRQSFDSLQDPAPVPASEVSTTSGATGTATSTTAKTKGKKELTADEKVKKQKMDDYVEKMGPYDNYDGIKETENQSIDGCFFVDALIRGLWLEAVGGTAMASFLAARIRMDKRIIAIKNSAGYNLWHRTSFGLQIGSYLMGESRFTSLEAAIMRVAALFSVRVYSCSTPSLISLEDHNLTTAGAFVMDKDVWNYTVMGVNQKKTFGHPFILNEAMLLPPMEFTAPPSFNLMFPPMYNSVQWNYDMDSDYTRGYFEQVDSWSVPGNEDLGKLISQVPNALFNVYNEDSKKKSDAAIDSASKGTGKEVDNYERQKPPLTLEERYKGVNVLYGSVEYNLAWDESSTKFTSESFNKEAKEKAQASIARLQKDYDEAVNQSNSSSTKEGNDSNLLIPATKLKETADALAAAKARIEKQFTSTKEGLPNAMNRHAVLKYLNSKYQGRVISIEMAFNPYIMCGFPGAVIADAFPYGDKVTKTVLGMVQQVRHTIAISDHAGEASTSVIMNNARFADEPTDVDPYGMPLYLKATTPGDAEINPTTLEYVTENYSIPEAIPQIRQIYKSEKYDLDGRTQMTDRIYAKDVIAMSGVQLASGSRSLTYLDQSYEPNFVARFYKQVFGPSNDFMVGYAYDKLDRRFPFMYDSIHEALEAIKSKEELMSDFESCMQYVSRNVCPADAFFHGILGLSYRYSKDGVDLFYNKSPREFDASVIETAYYGITTERWNLGKNRFNEMGPPQEPDPILSVELLKRENGGLMTSAGQFSSILEHIPVTAFIQERRDAAQAFADAASRWAESITLRRKS